MKVIRSNRSLLYLRAYMLVCMCVCESVRVRTCVCMCVLYWRCLFHAAIFMVTFITICCINHKYLTFSSLISNRRRKICVLSCTSLNMFTYSICLKILRFHHYKFIYSYLIQLSQSDLQLNTSKAEV
jgi:hypothetical protein